MQQKKKPKQQTSCSRVVVIGQSPTALGGLVVALRQAGHAVRVASTAKEGLELVADRGADLVVVCGPLPVSNGLRLCRRIRRNPGTAGLPVILVSDSFNSSRLRAHGMKAGADLCLGEPIAPLELQLQVERLLRLRQTETELRQSEERLRLATDAARVGIFEHHVPTGEMRCTPQAERLFGYTPGTPRRPRKDWSERVHPADLPKVLADKQRCMLERKASYRGEYRILWPDGTTRWISDLGQCHYDKAGRPLRTLGIIMDVTERKEFEEVLRRAQDQLETRVRHRTAQLQTSHAALAQSEERYRQLFQSVFDAVVVTDLETQAVVDVNNAAVRMFGYRREEFVGLQVKELTAEPKASALAIQGVLEGRVRRVPVRYYKRKDGSRFPVEISGSVFRVKNRQMLCGLIRDVSERQELEHELLRISEREQQRIAYDLHDGLGQQLVALGFSANALHRSLAARQQREAKDAQRIRELLESAIADVRRLTRGLQPVPLDGEGLMAALKELALTTSSLFKTRCRFQCVRPVVLSDNRVATHLFRIAQEAVTNAHKHGYAKQVLIRLGQEDNRLTLQVRDNGKGLPERPVANPGMGLRIMKHRARLIGASFEVERARKGGVLVTCRVSIKPAEPLSYSGAKKGRRR